MPAFESRYADHCARLEPAGLRRTLTLHDVATVADFSHNDYLGLANDPALIEAGHVAALRYGMGATGSRLLSGNLPLHVELEQAIATAKGTEAALVFGTGYQANATVLAALLDGKALGAEPLVFADRLNHASLHHACQLAGAHQIRYRHNDMTHLRALLDQRRSDVNPKFIVTETVFGMDGDVIDMTQMTALADEHDAFLYLDEAHATGILGERGYGVASGHIAGRGVAMGTFSKALGAAGAYIACSAAVRDYLVNRCTGFIYSTAPSPAVIGAVAAAWQRLPELAERRVALLQRAAQLRTRLHALGYDTGASATHIVPILIGDESTTLMLKDWLLQRGLIVSAIRPPTVPRGAARVRVALSAAHSDAQIDALVMALTQWKQRKEQGDS